MKKITTTLLLLLSIICFGQHSESGFCALHSENETWVSEFKKSDNKSDQIDSVVNKILSDSQYFNENPEIADIDDQRFFGNLPCSSECSMRFGLIYAKNKGIVLDLNKYPEFQDLIMEFTSDNIEYIDLNEQNKNNLYGYNDSNRSGIILYTKDKNLKKKIKATLKSIVKL